MYIYSMHVHVVCMYIMIYMHVHVYVTMHVFVKLLYVQVHLYACSAQHGDLNILRMHANL